jgi:DNA-binding protein HU-beta
MTKKEIVNQMADDLQLNSIEVSRAVKSFLKVMRKNIIAGESIYLRGFGTFGIKKVNQKKGRNIVKKTSVVIPAHQKPIVVFCKEIKKAVKKLPV